MAKVGIKTVRASTNNSEAIVKNTVATMNDRQLGIATLRFSQAQKLLKTIGIKLDVKEDKDLINQLKLKIIKDI